MPASQVKCWPRVWKSHAERPSSSNGSRYSRHAASSPARSRIGGPAGGGGDCSATTAGLVWCFVFAAGGGGGGGARCAEAFGDDAFGAGGAGGGLCRDGAALRRRADKISVSRRRLSIAWWSRPCSCSKRVRTRSRITSPRVSSVGSDDAAVTTRRPAVSRPNAQATRRTVFEGISEGVNADDLGRRERPGAEL